MINKKNTAFIAILFLGVFFWGIGVELANSTYLNFSYSIFSGWIVGLLCNIHERERITEVNKQKNVLLEEKNEKYKVIDDLNGIIEAYQAMDRVIQNYFSIEDSDLRKMEFSKYLFEIYKMNTSRIENENFNFNEKRTADSIKRKLYNMWNEFDMLKDLGDEENLDFKYTSQMGRIEFSIGALNDAQKITGLINERYKELNDLEKKIIELN